MRYTVVDVFTDRPFTGNALCVVVDECPPRLMQSVAREANLSETTFVTSVDRDGAAYAVRIFTPGAELPFAGHPSLGTAWVLGPGSWTQTTSGAVVTIDVDADGAEMGQPDPTLTEVDPTGVADALGLPGTEGAWLSVAGGMSHVLVPTDAPIDRLQPDNRALLAATRSLRITGVGVLRRVDDATLHARVFIPGPSLIEDPGTGSAAGPFGLLGRRLWSTDEDVVILQGAEMGRPCRIEVHAETGNLRVGGHVAACAEGRFVLGSSAVAPVGSSTL